MKGAHHSPPESRRTNRALPALFHGVWDITSETPVRPDAEPQWSTRGLPKRRTCCTFPRMDSQLVPLKRELVVPGIPEDCISRLRRRRIPRVQEDGAPVPEVDVGVRQCDHEPDDRLQVLLNGGAPVHREDPKIESRRDQGSSPGASREQGPGKLDVPVRLEDSTRFEFETDQSTSISRNRSRGTTKSRRPLAV